MEDAAVKVTAARGAIVEKCRCGEVGAALDDKRDDSRRSWRSREGVRCGKYNHGGFRRLRVQRWGCNGIKRPFENDRLDRH